MGVVKIRSRTQNNDDFALVDAAIGPSPDALVSCVVVVGTDADELRSGNGEANVKAFAAWHSL